MSLVAEWTLDFQCDGRLRLKWPKFPPPPARCDRNAAKPITNHFFRSNGRNKIFCISSSAAPKGAKISIFSGIPFIRLMVNDLRRGNQAPCGNSTAGAQAAEWVCVPCYDDATNPAELCPFPASGGGIH